MVYQRTRFENFTSAPQNREVCVSGKRGVKVGGGLEPSALKVVSQQLVNQVF